MAPPKHEERKLAIQMRSQGASIKEISDRLLISKSSASAWVSHIRLTESQVKSLKGRTSGRIHAGRLAASEVNRAKYQSARLAARKIGYDEANGKALHVAGCMLYWAEGTKSMNSAEMGNTDPVLLRKFVDFLRDLGAPPEKIKVSCRVHQTPGNASPLACRRFWASALSVSSSSVKVFSANDNRGSYARKSRYPHGVGRVAVYDYSIVQRIYGGIERYAGVEMPFGRK